MWYHIDVNGNAMQLTQHTDYGLRVLIFLGLKPQDQLATIQEIAEAYNISRNHLMKVVSKLATYGYIISTRGAGGGIRLAQSPADIIVGQVIQDLEPINGLVECMRPNSLCAISLACSLPNMLSRASAAFIAELNKYTIQDLLPQHKQDQLIHFLQIEPAS